MTGLQACKDLVNDIPKDNLEGGILTQEIERTMPAAVDFVNQRLNAKRIRLSQFSGSLSGRQRHEQAGLPAGAEGEARLPPARRKAGLESGY
jgi:hypothetical protein